MMGADGPDSEPIISQEDLSQALSRAAHDLNNLCSSTLGFAALAQESLAADSPAHEFLAEVVASADKTAALAQELAGLARAARRVRPS